VFQKRIFRGITRSNREDEDFELYELYDEQDLAECIKINRQKFAVRMIRMDNK
jgi:hypothetical protein